MLSTRVKNMSEDLAENGNINNYLEEIPDRNKGAFFDYALSEIDSFLKNRSRKIFKNFVAIFLVAGLISIALTIWYLPMVENSFAQKRIFDEKMVEQGIKKSHNVDQDIFNGQRELEKNTLTNSQNSNAILNLLGGGLCISFFVFIIPAIFFTINNISMKKYKALSDELKEQRYRHLQLSNITE